MHMHACVRACMRLPAFVDVCVLAVLASVCASTSQALFTACHYALELSRVLPELQTVYGRRLSPLRYVSPEACYSPPPSPLPRPCTHAHTRTHTPHSHYTCAHTYKRTNTQLARAHTATHTQAHARTHAALAGLLYGLYRTHIAGTHAL
jgi:hypothetical protein